MSKAKRVQILHPSNPLAWLALAFCAISGCITMTEGPGTATYGTRRQCFDTSALDTSLQRGISTRGDIEKALGKPSGIGGSFLPTDSEPKEVWFYEKIEVTSSGRHLSEKQDVLLVFLKGDRFDGFMWFSDNQAAK
jgi:hypothetical protein